MRSHDRVLHASNSMSFKIQRRSCMARMQASLSACKRAFLLDSGNRTTAGNQRTGHQCLGECGLVPRSKLKPRHACAPVHYDATPTTFRCTTLVHTAASVTAWLNGSMWLRPQLLAVNAWTLHATGRPCMQVAVHGARIESISMSMPLHFEHAFGMTASVLHTDRWQSRARHFIIIRPQHQHRKPSAGAHSGAIHSRQHDVGVAVDACSVTPRTQRSTLTHSNKTHTVIHYYFHGRSHLPGALEHSAVAALPDHTTQCQLVRVSRPLVQQHFGRSTHRSLRGRRCRGAPAATALLPVATAATHGATAITAPATAMAGGRAARAESTRCCCCW